MSFRSEPRLGQFRAEIRTSVYKHAGSTWRVISRGFPPRCCARFSIDTMLLPRLLNQQVMAAGSSVTTLSSAPTFALAAPWPRLAALHPRLPASDRVASAFPRSLSGRGVRAAMRSGEQERVKPGPGQESVWDYPRPPALEPVPKRIRIEFNSQTIADTTRAYRVLETSHPPVYYIPQADIKMEFVKRAPGSSFCEWKGDATYWTVQVGDRTAAKVGWSYESPTAPFRAIQSFIAFYCAPMDACYVGDERAQPQPGGFYGGWVTSNVVGPFKGGPGSWGW